MPRDPSDDSRLLAQIDVRVENIGRRLDEFIVSVERTLAAHETRLRTSEEYQAKMLAYGGAFVALLTVGWPILKSLLHISP